MKAVIQDISELSDSRELMESKPYPAGTYFTYILIMLLVIASFWASMSEIDIVVKANGVVRPLEKVSTLSSTASGKVIETNFENGDYVNQGDVLFRVGSENLSIQKEGIENQIQLIKKEIEHLEIFKESVEKNQNLFTDIENEVTENYYYKYKKYELENTKANERIRLLKNKIEENRMSLKGAKAYLKSVQLEEERFNGIETETEFYQSYRSYELNRTDLKMALDETEHNYNSKRQLYDMGSISKQEFDQTKLQYNQYKNNYKKLKSDALSSIQSKIEVLESRIGDYEGELRKVRPELKNNGSKSAYQTETLINIQNQLQTNRENLRKLEESIDSLTVNVNKTVVKAPISGRINLEKELVKGDFISVGTSIGTIVPKDGETFKIQIYVPNKDISNVDIGDKAKYRFKALPYKEYGVLEGTITSISVDANYNQERGQSFYLVEADVANKPLHSYKGTEANIKVGMALEAQVVTKTKSVLNYLLEKIDLRD